MPDFVLAINLKGKDAHLRSSLKHVTADTKKFGITADRAFKKANKGASTFGSIVKGVLAAGVIRRGFSMLGAGVRGVTTEFVAFDDAITAASAKFGIFDRESKSFKDLQKTARDIGAATEYTGVQAGEGLRFLAKAGWSAVDAMKALPSFVDLATASEMEFGRAADIATDVLGAFRLPVDTTADRLKSLARVNDVMSKAVNMSNIGLEDLFETIRDAGPISVDAGISIEKFSAIAAFIGGAGIKGSKGGTALKNAILNLATQTPKARKLFSSLKIDLADAKGNLRDPIKLFKELGDAMGGMGTKQKTASLALLFGKRAVSGASVSISGAKDKLVEFEKALIDSGGNTKKLAEFMRTSLGNRLAQLKSAAVEAGFKFLDAFSKKFPGAIDAAINAIRNFDMNKVTDAIKLGIQFIKDLKQAFIEFKPWVLGAVGAFTAYHVITKAIVAFKFVKYLYETSAAMKLINIIMAANPIGAVALAVGALITLVVVLIDNWEELGDALSILWVDIKAGFQSLLSWFEPKIRTLIQWFDPLNLFFDEYKGGDAGSKPGGPGSGPAPNAPEADSRQSISFDGRLDFNGAPEGSSFSQSTSGAKPLKSNLGSNP